MLSAFTRRGLALVLAVLLTTALLPPAAAWDEYLPGDPDNNTAVNAADALLALQHSVRIAPLTGRALAAAEVSGDGAVNAADALLILQYSVRLINMFPNKLTGEEQYYALRDAAYGVTGEDFIDNGPVDLTDTQKLLETFGREAAPSDVNTGVIDEDDLLHYTPLSDAAAKAGTLHKYDKVEKTVGRLELDGTVVTYAVPKRVTAYDAVPVEYSVSGFFPGMVHLSATTFEEPDRYADPAGPYFDCNLPGMVELEMTYNGYVVGHNVADAAPSWSYDIFGDEPRNRLGTQYPAYNTDDLVVSGNLPAYTDRIWLNFGFKNVGNTILDSEGNGAFCFCPTIQKKQKDGTWAAMYQLSTDNLKQRIYDTVYPGESGDFWCCFLPMGSRGRYAFDPGEYKVTISAEIRNERDANGWAANYVGGRTCGQGVFTFTVSEEGEITTPEPMVYNFFGGVPRNKWLGKFEEFQSSYRSMRTFSQDESQPSTGVIWVQPAPWNTTLSLKLIHGDFPDIAAAHIPLEVESDSISVTLNPYNPNYHVKEDGTREPLLATQSMVDMRGNTQMGPDALSTAVNDLRNMKEAGINLLTSTMAFSFDRNQYDSFKFMMDAARVMGFEFEGFCDYPYNSDRSLNYGKPIGTYLPGGLPDFTTSGWGWEGINQGNGAMARFVVARYGDMLWTRGDGVLPIAAEDTWGWLTIDHDWRFGLTKNASIQNYRNWLQTVYPTIGDLNAAYGSDFGDFTEIDPREEGILQDTHYGAYNFTRSTGVFRERSRAIAEMDVYRTLARINDYREMFQAAAIPNTDARLWIRYEGTTWLAPGIDPNTKNTRYRQFYYEQKRNAVIPEMLAASGVVFGGSNYDGTPLSPAETYELTKRATQAGLTMSKMPMIAHMRDTVINERYGDIKYVTDYNLSTEYLRGACVDTTEALFPYLKAMYEGGGIPGVMWQDYYCDGYISSTQYKELKFYTQKIAEMLQTEDGKAWATDFEAPARGFNEAVKAIWSYPRDYIEKVLADTPRDCHFDRPYTK